MSTPTTATPAFGSFLYREDPNNPGTYIKIPNCSGIQPGGPKMNFANTPQFDGGGYNEVTPTLNDLGSLTADIDFNPADPIHQGLVADQAARTKISWRDAYPDNSYRQFNGYIESIVPEKKVNDVVRSKLVIRATGGPTN